MLIASSLCLLALTLLPKSIDALVIGDRVSSLPGWSAPLPTEMYSGYLPVGANKKLHYVLVTSELDPKTNPNIPVVFWLNGGPGCSSLDGFLYEHGPFRVSADGSSLEKFEYAWNKLAHTVYLEAPAGVGFSYSTNKDDYVTNDDKTADDNAEAAAMFFKYYPEYNKNPFFITGESYGGVYVPTMAEAILKRRDAGNWAGAALTGIAVGNGCTGTEIGVCGGQSVQYRTEYLLQTAFIPEVLKSEIKSKCGDWSDKQNSECDDVVKHAYSLIGNIDIYNVYGDCINGDSSFLNKQTNNSFTIAQHFSDPGQYEKVFDFNFPSLGEVNEEEGNVGASSFTACLNSIAASDYLNREDVQKALHVRKPDFRWYNEAWTSQVSEDLNLPEKASWHPWMYKNKTQVAGYATVYDTSSESHGSSFTFITIRGGRHEVPETAPVKAYEMLQRFTQGEDF
eukprot:g3322.t1